LDEGFIEAVATKVDWLPTGEVWVIVGRAEKTVLRVKDLIAKRLKGKVVPVAKSFEEWLKDGLPELFTLGILK